MSQAEALEKPLSGEEPVAISLLAEKTALAADKRLLKGRINDLQFDNLSEEDLAKAKQKIFDDHQAEKTKYLSEVTAVKGKLLKLRGKIKTIKETYAKKISVIKATEHNPSFADIGKAKVVYGEVTKKENASFTKELTSLKEEIYDIQTSSKKEVAELKKQYSLLKKTPMKQAEKVQKLDAAKLEIYKKDGVADLEILTRTNKIALLKASHKKAMAKYANDLHLETNRVQTLIGNTRAEEKEKLAPLKEELHDLEVNYKPVAPLAESAGLGLAEWGRKWVAKQKASFSSWPGFGDWFIHNAVYLIILVMVIATAAAKPAWLNFNSFIAIVKHTSSLLPLALGVAGTIVLTGTDLSLGRIWGFTALIAAAFLGYTSTSGIIMPWTANMPWIWIIVVLFLVMGIGGIFGAVNGFFVAEFSIHPFVVTLATQLIVYGAILLYGDALSLSVAFNGQSPMAVAYTSFVSGGFYIGGTLVEWYNVFAVVMLIVMSFIWYKTKFGKAMFAVGCNPDAANVSGINVKKTIIWTFALAGLFYGIGGFEYNPINGGAQLSTGTGGELDPITAVVIGGVSFTGGIGKVSGVLIGCILLKVIDSCLLALGASTAWINIAKGSIILFAVALDMKKYIVKK